MCNTLSKEQDAFKSRNTKWNVVVERQPEDWMLWSKQNGKMDGIKKYGTYYANSSTTQFLEQNCFEIRLTWQIKYLN